MNKLLLTLLMFTSGFTLVAQTNFRSAGTGVWTTPGTWELESPDGSNNWVATLITPTSASGIVTIRSPHIITFSSPIIVDEVTVDPGGELIVSGVTLTLANNPDGLYVDGSLTLLTGAAVSVPVNNLIFRDGSIYNHDRDGGTIPVAVWQDGSTCSINGITSTVPGGLTPVGGFWHFTWNSNQAGIINLLGQLQDINGNFDVSNTGNQILRLKSNQTSTLNIDGNFTMDIGTGSLSLASGANTETINLLGNLVLTSGTLTESGAGTRLINFNGVNQSVGNDTGASMTQTIDVVVSASTTLTMLGESFLAGSGTFTLSGNLSLESVNAAGALVTGTAQGNLRMSGVRTYNSGSRIIYAGASAQFIGNGNSGSGGVTTEISNFSGVTNSGAVQVNDLILTTGSLQISNGSLTINGNVTPNSNFISVSGATTDLVVNGPANLLNFPFPPGNPSFRDFTLNRPSGGVSFGISSVTITRTTTLTSGRLFFDSQLTLGTVGSAGGNLILGPGGDLGGLPAKSLVLNGNTALTSDLNFAPGENTLSSLAINKGNGGISVSIIGNPLEVTNTLTITNGQLDITANNLTLGTATPGTLNLNSAGSISNSSPTGVPWNLVYSGTTAINPTGFEIPVSGDLLSLSGGNSGTITLDQSLNIGAGGFTLNSGTFNSGANAISTPFLTISGGTFTAPSTTLTLTGNLSIGGTYTNNGGNLIFGGTSTQSIGGTNAPATQFSTITVNPLATLDAPTTLQIASRLTNNGSFNSGVATNTVLFVANTTGKIIDGSSKIIFQNLTVNGNATAIPDLINENAGGIDLNGVLNLGTNSNCTFDADGVSNNRVLTLLSTADRPTVDASVAAMNTNPAVPQVLGDVTVQRYMNRQGVALYNFQVWRNISSPVNTTEADIQPELPVTGTFTGNDNAAMATSLSSMFRYAENVITDTDGSGIADLDDGFTQFPVAANTESFARGQGYSIFIFGSDEPVLSQGNSKWDVRGPIWSGTFNLPVTFNSSGTLANDGWNLVGNPYPSTINWSAAGWTKTRVANAVYMSDYSTANPFFAAYVNGVSTNGGTNFIAVGQGFWVKATAAAPVLTIRESVKAAGTQTTFFRQTGPTDLIRVTLSRDNLTDETVIYFADSATASFDAQYDALKFRNPYWYLNLSSISGDEQYAINAMPLSSCASQVPLDVSDVVTGNYQLTFTEFESLSSDMKIQLRDHFANTLVDVRQAPTYPFIVDDTNPNTFGANRFSLAFTYEGGLVTIASQAPGVCDPSAAQVTINSTSEDFEYSLMDPTSESVIAAAVRGNGSVLHLSVPSSMAAVGVNTYLIKAENVYCSTLQVTSLVDLTVVAIPDAVVATAGTICGAEGKTTLTATGAPVDGFYRWYDGIDAGGPIANETQSTFITPILNASTTYFVAAVNSLGCEGIWVEVMANVTNPGPAAIEVVNPFTLRSNYSTGNQWYLNDQPIVGATGQTLNAPESGVYRLDVNVDGCIVSDNRQFIVTALENSSQQVEGITVYPNPVGETLKIAVESEVMPSGSLYNLKGSLAGSIGFTTSGSGYHGEYTFNEETAGYYFLRIERGTRVDIIRIIKH